MLLAQLTASLTEQYAGIQAQIEALQEQQRLIQAQLQRVGGIESKMESAAALVAEAIAETREVCPEELQNYRETINGLFGDAPIARIEAGADEVEDAVTPAPSGDGGEPDPIDIEGTEVAEEKPEETEVENSEVISPTVPSRTLHQQPAKPLQWLAAKRGIEASGLKRHQVAKALNGLVTQSELEEAIEQTLNVG